MADSATLHRIIGRDDELARLRSDLQLAAAGATTAVIISGEAGIGKTVLCEAATAELSDQRVIRLTVNALPLQALRTGLAPLRTALRRSSARPRTSPAPAWLASTQETRSGRSTTGWRTS